MPTDGAEQCTETQTIVAAVTSSAASSFACLLGRILLQWGLNVGARKRALNSNVNDRIHSFVSQLGISRPVAVQARPPCPTPRPSLPCIATLHHHISLQSPAIKEPVGRGGGAWLGEVSSERSGGRKGSTPEGVAKQQRDWMTKQQEQQGGQAAAAVEAEVSAVRRRKNPYARLRRRGVEAGRPSRCTRRAVSEAAHGTWLLLYPSQIAEAEDGPEIGFYHPPGEDAGIHTSGELGLSAPGTSIAAPRRKAVRFSFVPVTDIRSAGARVLVRFELTSLPPGVQTVQASLVRGTRLPSAPSNLTYSATCDALPSSQSGSGSGPSTSSCRTAGVARYLEAKAGAQARPLAPLPSTALTAVSPGGDASPVPIPQRPMGVGRAVQWASTASRKRETTRWSPLAAPPPALGAARAGSKFEIKAPPSPSAHLSPPSSPPPSPPTSTSSPQAPPLPAPAYHAAEGPSRPRVRGGKTVELKLGFEVPERIGTSEGRGKSRSSRESQPRSTLRRSDDETHSAPSRTSRYSVEPGARNMPPRLTRELTRALDASPGRSSHADPADRGSGLSRGSHSTSNRSRSSGGSRRPPFVAPRLAWPVDRGWVARGWRLRVAWAYNGALVLGGLLWLAVMLRAYDIDDGRDLDGFWRTYAIALAQGLLLQDSLKVLFITFVSPPFWARILKPGTKRAEALRCLLRLPIGWILRI